MKIGEGVKPAAISKTSSTKKPAASEMASIPAIDETIVAGIPEAELTPKVREALTALIAEVQSLRQSLQSAVERVDELEAIADRDPLVDAFNRRAFVRELNRVLSMIDRYGVNSSLVFIDLNDLKKINDEGGHGAGDAALEKVASIISANIRQTDILGRLGGDEFGLLLTHIDNDSAHKKADHLAKLIGQEEIAVKQSSFRISVSFGVVPLSATASAQDALDCADAAMYEAKRQK